MHWKEFFDDGEKGKEIYQKYLTEQADAQDRHYEVVGEVLEKHGIINPQRARLSSLES